jgi:hypothetical protein
LIRYDQAEERFIDFAEKSFKITRSADQKGKRKNKVKKSCVTYGTSSSNEQLHKSWEFLKWLRKKKGPESLF